MKYKDFEFSIDINPAFDKRHNDPNKSYGIHGVSLRFYLRGEKGVIQFVLYTNWHLPHVQKEMDNKPLNDIPYMFHKPQPADIGYHSPIPIYNEQKSMTDKCPLLDNKPCYYDGSGLNAEKVFDKMVEGGLLGLQEEMEDWYNLYLK